MQQQRRCLTGMANGLPVAVPARADSVVIHTFATSSNSGLAELDVVNLYLHNGDETLSAKVEVSFLSPANAPLLSLIVAVAPGTSLRVFDEDAFGGPLSGLGGNKIALSFVPSEGEESSVSAWGWFFRSRG